MKESVLDRIKYIIEIKKISITSFSKMIGMPQTTVNNYMLGKRKISFEFTEKILNKLEDINPIWLFTGEGEMKKNNIKNGHSINISGENSGTNVVGSTINGNIGGTEHNINLVLPKSGYQKIINSKGEETTIQLDDDNLNSVANLSNENKSLVDKIDLLTQMVSDLRERIKEKDEIIGMLRNQIDRT